VYECHTREAVMTRDEKRAAWAGVVERWRQSGLSKAGFCRQEGLRTWQFDYWCRRLAAGSRGPELCPEAAGFVPLRFAPEAAGSGVTLVVGAVRLELAAGFDAAVLARVLRLLGGDGC
jgi:hypothetical protein